MHTRQEPGQWSRSRLLLVLAAITTAVVLVLAGVGLAVWYAITGRTLSAAPATSATVPPAPLTRDEIAAAPMASVDPQAAFTPDPATSVAPSIRIPAGTGDRGPGGVPTGFPHTSEAAVAQWAAIAQTVLEGMSLDTARQVHAGWVSPGGPHFEGWTLTRNVRSFLAAGRQGGPAKDTTTVVTAMPVAALVKGIDGPDWVVACVLLDVKASISAESRMGYGLCSRMEWTTNRWRVAPGAEPALAPSAWPGSVAAVEAGWLTIEAVE